MKRIIAVCGGDCAECEAFLATQADDEEWKKRVATSWQAEYHIPEVSLVDVTCDGCLATSGRLSKHCYECDIRLCGIARSLPNCAHCPDYETCDKLDRFAQFVPTVRSTLAEIRRSL
jgi:hypothetical protein